MRPDAFASLQRVCGQGSRLILCCFVDAWNVTLRVRVGVRVVRVCVLLAWAALGGSLVCPCLCGRLV